MLFEDADAAKVREFDRALLRRHGHAGGDDGLRRHAGAVDREPDLRRPGSAHALHRQPARHTIPYLRSPVAGLPMVHWNESHRRGAS